jgi:hypothetical protein
MEREVVCARARSWRAGSMKVGAALLLLMSAVGCRDAYRDKSEQMYEALMQLRADVQNDVEIEQFARHLSTADEIREQWVRSAGRRAMTHRSARELSDAMQIYGHLGTMRMLNGSPRVDHSTMEQGAYVRSEQAMTLARRDLDLDR